MLSEWLTETYPVPPNTIFIYLRVGVYEPEMPGVELTPEEREILGVRRRRADAVVITPNEIHLIEAALRADPGHVEKLEQYRRLLPHTPRLQEYFPRPIVCILLYAIEDPIMTTRARELGFRCVRYTPKWYPEYLRSLAPRHRRAPISGFPR